MEAVKIEPKIELNVEADNSKSLEALTQASTEVTTFVSSALAEVAKVEDYYKGLIPDASTRQGYDFCRDVRRDVLPMKSKLEAVRKTLKAPVIEMGKLIDSNLNPMIERLDVIFRPFETEYRRVDKIAEEKENVRKLAEMAGRQRLANLRDIALGANSSDIEMYIGELRAMEFPLNIYREFVKDMNDERDGTVDRLLALCEERKMVEQMRAEQAKREEQERIAKAKQDELDRKAAQEALIEQGRREAAEKAAAEAKIAAAKAEAAAAKAQADAIEAAAAAKRREEQLKAESERQLAAQAQHAIDEANRRLAAEKAAKDEADRIEAKRVANGKHRKAVQHNVAKFIAENTSMSLPHAEELVDAIEAGYCPELLIVY